MKNFLLLSLICFTLASCSSNHENEEVKHLLDQQLKLNQSNYSVFQNRIMKKNLENPAKFERFIDFSAKVYRQNEMLVEILEKYKYDPKNISIHQVNDIYSEALDKLQSMALDLELDFKYVPTDVNKLNKTLRFCAMRLNILAFSQELLDHIMKMSSYCSWGFIEPTVAIQNKNVSADRYSMDLSSPFFRTTLESYVSIDSILLNNHRIQPKVRENAIYTFHRIKIDSLPEGDYKIFGNVKTFPNDDLVEEKFYDEFTIEKN